MMNDSIRLGVLKQLSAYIAAEVTTLNGYDFDLTAAVFRGRLWFGTDDPTPMVSILEGMMPDEDPQAGGFHQLEQSDNWKLLIQGWAADDDLNPTDPAHQLMACVKKALGKMRATSNDGLFKGTAFENVADFVIGPGVVRPADQLSAKAYFWQRITLKITERVDEPFL